VLLSEVGKNVKVRGLPHLAKNERDMGHPTILGRVRSGRDVPTSDLSRKVPQDLFGGEQIFLGIDPDGVEGGMHHVDADPFLQQS
jgi:hypothetical protein